MFGKESFYSLRNVYFRFVFAEVWNTLLPIFPCPDVKRILLPALSSFDCVFSPALAAASVGIGADIVNISVLIYPLPVMLGASDDLKQSESRRVFHFVAKYGDALLSPRFNLRLIRINRILWRVVVAWRFRRWLGRGLRSSALLWRRNR